MKSALYLLNVLALVALVSFQFEDKGADPALIQSQASHSMPAQTAKLAVMHASSPHLSVSAADHSTQPTQSFQTERYTF